MRLNQKGEATIVVLASWLIVAGFLGLTLLIGSAMTRSPKTDLADYKEIHKSIPDNYDEMTAEQKRIFWRDQFDEKKGEK